MTEKKTCKKCGSEFPTNALAGVCPRCLLQAGLMESSPAMVSAGTVDTILTESAVPSDQPNDLSMVLERTSTKDIPEPGKKIHYFGEYELLAEIARGGMGVVYRARQVRLNRIVAIKMILAGQFAGQADVQRFQTEAEAAAQLDHAGIVPVFEVGQYDRHHYFSMGLVDGDSLAKRIADGPLPPRIAADLVLHVTEAIQYAHGKGVIHRDLKPANVLLDKTGQPKVTDFGLAKRIQGDSHLTASGQILGTPSYMPPEQAAGRVDQVSETADVYSLGAILYATLTGRPPFQADNPLDTVMQVIEREPISPRALNPAVPLDLETICLKCLEKDRRKRYGSAGELGEELRRYLDGKPILARPVGWVQRAWRWCRRNPVVASLLVAVGTSLVAGTIVSTMFAVEARNRAAGERKNREEAEKQTILAEAHLNRAEWLLYANEIASAQREGELNNPALATRVLNRTPKERHGWEYHFLRRQNEQSLRFSVRAHDQKILALAASPDGRMIVTNNKDGSITVWDLLTGTARRSIPIPVAAVAITVSPDGRRLAAGSLTNGQRSDMHFLSIGESTETPATMSVEGRLVALAFDQTAKRMAISAYDPSTTTAGMVRVVDVSRIGGTGDPIQYQLPIRARHVGFTADDRHLFAVGTDGVLTVCDSQSGAIVRRFQSRALPDQALALTPDAELYIIGNDAGVLEMWNTSTHSPPVEMALNEWGYSVAFSSDGQRVVSGSSKLVTIWDAATGDPVIEIPAHTGTVHTVAFHPDGDKVVSGSWDGSLRLWEVASGKKLYRVGGGTREYDSMSVSPNGDLFATGTGFTLEIRLHDAHTGILIATLTGASERVGVTAFSANGAWLLSGGESGEVAIWDVSRRAKRWTARLGQGRICSVTASANNQWVAALSQSGAIALWDIETGQQKYSLEEPGAYCLRFTPDNRRLASAGADAALKFWTVDTGQKVCSIAGHKGRIYSMAFSPDGRRLATTGDAGAVFVWDAGEPLPSLASPIPAQP